MMRVKTLLAALAGFALILVIPLAAANGPAAKATDSSTAKVTTVGTARCAWPAEALTGKITMVDPGNKLVVVQTPDGVLYDMLVTAKTVIRSADHSMGLHELSQDVNKSVSVKFIPERRGDVAKSIHITG